jgi:hypothetical protein
MSWATFKSSLLPSMQSHTYGRSFQSFANAFTLAYDSAIRGGGETVSRIPISTGNTAGMQSTLNGLLQQTQMSRSPNLLQIIGPAIITYWTGATLMPIPPIIPPPGAIASVATLQAPVISPGSWSPLDIPPNNNSNLFLDAFITSAKIHLSTLNGMYFVSATYPAPTGVIIAPGIVPWTGYIVPG